MDSRPRLLTSSASTDASNQLAKELFSHFISRENLSQRTSEEPKRIVAFVGAGASRAAGLPSGQQLKEHLFEKLTTGPTAVLTPTGARQECLQYWLRHSKPSKPAGDDPVGDPDFGLLQFCQALSPYPAVRKSIRDLIKEALKTPATCPLLTYELLAHLLNHRFVDHVVSLNFDQLLDESLKDELGEEGVDIVVSDRDIPSSTLLDNLDERARCVKPHGSITVPDSMRFTMEDTSDISGAMLALVEQVIFGPSAKRPTRTTNARNSTEGAAPPRVILIFMGWACAEREFQRLLRSHHSQIDQIYWFYPAVDKGMASYVKNFRKEFESANMAPATGKVSKLHEIAFRGDLGNALLKIFEKLRACSERERVETPPIARHLLYCYCFSPIVDTRQPKRVQIASRNRLRELHDAWDRLKFEIFYFSLKTKGSFSTHNMAQVRRIQQSLARFQDACAQALKKKIGIPYEMSWDDERDLVQQCFAGAIIKEGTENYTYETVDPPGIGPSLDQLLRYFWGMRTRHPKTLSGLLSYDEGSPQGGSGMDSCLNAMYGHFRQIWRTKARRPQLDLAANLARHLETIRALTETEIAKRQPTRHLWLFRNAKKISSIGELKQRTKIWIREQPWTCLRIIAETGEWLLDPRIMGSIVEHCQGPAKVSMHLIVRAEAVPLALGADHVFRVMEELQNVTGGKLELKVDPLRWWRHNRHLTLLSNEAGLLCGIYFRRRLKTPLIYPVSVEDPHDLRVLEQIFDRYVTKSRLERE